MFLEGYSTTPTEEVYDVCFHIHNQFQLPKQLDDHDHHHDHHHHHHHHHQKHYIDTFSSLLTCIRSAPIFHTAGPSPSTLESTARQGGKRFQGT